MHVKHSNLCHKTFRNYQQFKNVVGYRINMKKFKSFPTHQQQTYREKSYGQAPIHNSLNEK